MEKDDKARLILNILDADWPTAVQIIPAAIKMVSRESASPECVSLLKASLGSYQRSLGMQDRDRLEAFLEPFLAGLTELLLSEPTVTAAVQDIKSLLDGAVKSDANVVARNEIECLLLPEDSSIGQIWRDIKAI
ncbi:hypothetical protein [Pseudomonas sp. LS-2]|uniref:hypothetical protein n=1 Tax=Pseudomonas sp. LS-2 TaxID=2315859 RepID=UPI0010584A3B|nr:hypothetical protein [Pseudomonas sp. LS-2]